jgi:predicted nucleotidyltransferase component of viral defense system
MRISRERLLFEAEATGFRAEVLEKAILLLNLLEGFRSHPYLKERLAIKGGTALNFFVFHELPRLSVDVDLNYIGAAEREVMLAERPKVEEAIQAVCSREGYNIRGKPSEHAGGKWFLRYESALGMGGNLEVDLNFMFRIPLWPVMNRDSFSVGSYRATGIPILDIHELAAGKLTALFARSSSRDLFDVHLLLTRGCLETQFLRLAFVIYGAMKRKDWRTVTVEDIKFEQKVLEDRLLPLLREDIISTIKQTRDWGNLLVQECRSLLDVVLPFKDTELEFLDRLLEQGEVVPSLLTSDETLAERIKRHPSLEWKALNIRQFKQR